MARDTSDLLHGTLDLLVLKAVATQPLHGFGLTKRRQMLRTETATWKRYVSAISNVLETA